MNDAEDLFALRSNPDAMKYIDKPLAKSASDIEELIKRIEDGVNENASITWGITFHEMKQLIGTIGFHRIEKEHFRAEIGYMILPEFWNKGITGEAIKRILDFGFNEMQLHSIEARVNPGNRTSMHLLGKNNFVKEAHFHESYFFDGKFLDTAVFSLLSHRHKYRRLKTSLPTPDIL